MITRRFRKCFDLAEIPNEWQLVRFTLDWDGRPLLLFVEGKPTTPDFHTDPEAWSRWYRTPPKAHHLVYWETGERRTIQFEQSQGLSTFHVQRFDGGGFSESVEEDKRRCNDAQGNTRFELNLGDASEDLQTKPQGLIWVSYFDEGVYGGSWRCPALQELHKEFRHWSRSLQNSSSHVGRAFQSDLHHLCTHTTLVC